MNIEELASIAMYGAEVEEFLKGPIGRKLQDYANKVTEESLEKLATVDPDDSKAIRNLQEKCRTADLVMSFLVDAIERGYQAGDALDELAD
jgi:hypothetical protein